MEVWADEIVEIADDSTLDVVTKEGRNGATYQAVDQENIQRARLRVDTRKFLMAKIAPSSFGDKVEVTGQVEHTHTVDISDRERMRRLATFMVQDAAVLEGQAEEVEPGQADDGGAEPAEASE